MRGLALVLVLAAALAPALARASALDALDPTRTWYLRSLRFTGQSALRGSELRGVMSTQARPWYAVWRKYPEFDPAVLEADLDQVRLLYRSRGYYQAQLTPDVELPAAGDAVRIVIHVDEGPAVKIERVDVTFEGTALPPEEERKLLADLPIKQGETFTQKAYDAAFARLRTAYRDRGYARVNVEKKATVDVAQDRADVTYRVVSGPSCVFGETSISGTQRYDPEVIRRELTFQPGTPFTQKAIDKSRENLVTLHLFRTIRLEEQPGDDPRVAIEVRVTEAPPREVRLGVGYDTEEGIRGLASWRNYDFLGGARQLGLSARASQLERAIIADFLQPHFPGHNSRTRLIFTEAQEDEDPWTLVRTRISPRLEWKATEQVTGYVFYRAEYDVLTEVNTFVRNALPRASPSHGVLSGLGIGADWNATDDLIDPTRGWILGGSVEPIGGVLGGDFGFLRLIGESRAYVPLVRRLTAAARLRLGTEVLTGDTQVPLYERFYAGGINSVRGYGRWRVGPLVANEPIGGRSLVETSFELRHPITETIGAAVFVDAGQLGKHSFTFPFTDLQYGVGFGVRYKSPVGPIRVDLGFPLERPPGDQSWQVYLSLGQTF